MAFHTSELFPGNELNCYNTGDTEVGDRFGCRKTGYYRRNKFKSKL